MTDSVPFNPLDKKSLAESIIVELEKKPVQPLAVKKSFIGAGVYLIYYCGKHPFYNELNTLVGPNGGQVPIYAGKAIPKGGRKGGDGLEANVGANLYSRLQEHAESIIATSDLKIGDFFCRYLSVDDIWIPLGEQLLIGRYKPIWNHLIDGFGNHAPGGGRDKQKRSPWDELHPGRGWARGLPQSKVGRDELIARIYEFWEKYKAAIT